MPKTTPTLSRRTFAAGLLSAPLWSLPAWTQTPALPKEVRIGYQKGSAILLLDRKTQAVEKRLKALGVEKLTWVEFQFGPPLLEALGAGAIDLGSVGDTPPIFAQAGQAHLVYVAANPSSQHAVLVPKDSPLQTVADLKGRKVAFGKGSSAHNVTIKALAAAGLKPSDITQVFLSPADATAAFNGGNVDAWVVWDPYFAIAQQRYGARALVDTITQPSLASSFYYMANRDFAQKQGALLAEILKTLQQTTHWASANRDELVQLASQDTGMDPEVWRTAYGRANLDLQPISTAHVAQQQQLADSFHALGIIPRKLQVQEIVWNWQV